MEKFKIEFEFEEDTLQDLRAFPKNPLSPLDIQSGGPVSIFFDGVIIPPEAEKSGRKYSNYAYFLNLFSNLLEVRAFSENPRSMSMQYGGADLYVSRTGQTIQVSYGGTLKKDASVDLSFKEFLEEVIRSSGAFIDKLVEINPALVNHPEVVKLVKERNKTMKFLEAGQYEKIDLFRIAFEPLEGIKTGNIPTNQIGSGDIAIETAGKISIYFDGKLVQNPWAKEKKEYVDYTDTEYRWYFFNDLLSEAKKFDENPHTVDFSDNPLRLYFKRENTEVSIKFGTISGGRDVSLPSTILGETRINYLDFLEEVLRITREFYQQIIWLNYRLRSNVKVVEFIEKRNDLLKLIENLEQ